MVLERNGRGGEPSDPLMRLSLGRSSPIRSEKGITALFATIFVVVSLHIKTQFFFEHKAGHLHTLWAVEGRIRLLFIFVFTVGL